MSQPIAQISAADLSDWLGSPDKQQPLLLDVRENWEFEICKLPGSLSRYNALRSSLDAPATALASSVQTPWY